MINAYAGKKLEAIEHVLKKYYQQVTLEGIIFVSHKIYIITTIIQVLTKTKTITKRVTILVVLLVGLHLCYDCLHLILPYT
jgi:hypothetical protein